MKTIWKYQAPIRGNLDVHMPLGADILCVQTQYGEPNIWALVDPGAVSVKRKFVWHGTGHSIDGSSLKYIGTVQLNNGNLVFHLFEDLT